MIALYLILVFVISTTVYLLVVGLVPNLYVKPQKLKSNPQSNIEYDKEDVYFSVNGAVLSGSLFRPKDKATPSPCIIMGNGFGGTKDLGLDPYAAVFQSAGFTVLTFDYRYFGKSAGTPRQLVDIKSQLEDWQAAIDYAKTIEGIDPKRIGLWGSSLSSGHVFVSAARNSDIACISLQCPSLDGKATSRKGAKRLGPLLGLKLVMHAQRDLVRSWFKLSPHMIPIVGEPGSISMMNTEDAFEFFNDHVSDGFVNEVCARVILSGSKYRPITYVKNVKCPTLIQICDRDTIADEESTRKVASILGDRAELVSYPINHFEIYINDGFVKAVSDQAEFFKKHL